VSDLGKKRIPLKSFHNGDQNRLFIPESPGNFLLQFDHPNVLFSLIIREWDKENVHEQETLPLIFLAKVKEVFTFDCFLRPRLTERSERSDTGFSRYTCLGDLGISPLKVSNLQIVPAVLVKSSFQFRDAGFQLGYSRFLLFNERDDCIRVDVPHNTDLFTLHCHFTPTGYIFPSY